MVVILDSLWTEFAVVCCGQISISLCCLLEERAAVPTKPLCILIYMYSKSFWSCLVAFPPLVVILGRKETELPVHVFK